MMRALPYIGVLRDLVDLALTAWIIQRLSRLIRGALAVRIMLALCSLLVGHLLARLLALQGLRLLLDTLLVSSVLVLAVIFQTDMRRACASLGKTREERGDGMSDAIDEVADAVEALVSKKIGGLIVIERAVPVDNYLVVGTEIDAKVTSELISSIFLPYSPIHDGAVIIQRGKLTKAGCFLPLTQNPEVSKTMGTRHRAAMGLSELVDAVVIVVSEETGQVSVMTGGRKSENLDPQGLRRTLRRMVDPRWLK